MNLGGSLMRQKELDTSTNESTHIANIGRYLVLILLPFSSIPPYTDEKVGIDIDKASQDGLTYSCSMYTSPTNVPEESAESFVSLEADTENLPSIGLLLSLISS